MGKLDKKPSVACGGGNSPAKAPQKDPSVELQSNPEFRKIASWLSGVTFRKKAFGGLDPVDVWKKTEELNRYYENALIAERVRYDLQLEQLKQYAARDPVTSATDCEREEHG